jgi:hypothetical protein
MLKLSNESERNISNREKLRLWSSLDGSSHSIGRKENKRYKDEDDCDTVNNDELEDKIYPVA